LELVKYGVISRIGAVQTRNTQFVIGGHWLSLGSPALFSVLELLEYGVVSRIGSVQTRNMPIVIGGHWLSLASPALFPPKQNQ